jgi:hypothetical protein
MPNHLPAGATPVDERSPSDPARSDASTSGTPATGASPAPASGSSQAPGDPPAGATSGTPPSGEAPGLRTQFGATRSAAIRLIRAHVELGRSEFDEILDEVKRAGALIGVAISLLLFVAILLPVGSILWFGEWLFGSMGWGVLLGTELFVGMAVALVLIAIGRPAGRVVGLLVVSLVIGVALGVVLGYDLSNEAYKRIGESVVPGIDIAWRLQLVGAVVGAIVLGVVGLLLGARGGGVIGVAFLGLFVGAFTAITFDLPAGAGVGAAVALGLWPALLGLDVARAGVDTEALKARFWPSQTIETTKETIEWVREQTPLGPKS